MWARATSALFLSALVLAPACGKMAKETPGSLSNNNDPQRGDAQAVDAGPPENPESADRAVLDSGRAPTREDARASAASEPAMSEPTQPPPPPGNYASSEMTVAGVTTWDPLACHVPVANEPEDPVARERWALARDYCLALAEGECVAAAILLSDSSDGCSVDELVDACIGDVLAIRENQIQPECDDAWRASIECGASATYELPCGGASADFPYGPEQICGFENDALLNCVADHDTWNQTQGSYTTCSYGPGEVAECSVTCRIGDAQSASLACSEGEGPRQRCSCSINGNSLNEGSTLPGWVEPIVVEDCADAARQAADGLCTNRVDCCVDYFDGVNQQCQCGPPPSPLGFDSCEALANYVMGEVVDICPQWAPRPNSCWPPPCEN